MNDVINTLRDIACCLLVVGSAEVPRCCWPSCSFSCWQCIDALPWMPCTGDSRSWATRNCGKSWGLGHPGILILILKEPSWTVQLWNSENLWAFSGFPHLFVGFERKSIVPLEILGSSDIRSNMPRYSAQIDQHRDRQKQMPVSDERFLHQTIQ